MKLPFTMFFQCLVLIGMMCLQKETNSLGMAQTEITTVSLFPALGQGEVPSLSFQVHPNMDCILDTVHF